MFSKVRNKVQALYSRLSSQDNQERYFEIQKNSFKQLAECDGYSALVEYWELELNQLMSRLSDPKTSDDEIRYLQGRCSVAKDFLNFLTKMQE